MPSAHASFALHNILNDPQRKRSSDSDGTEDEEVEAISTPQDLLPSANGTHGYTAKPPELPSPVLVPPPTLPHTPTSSLGTMVYTEERRAVPLTTVLPKEETEPAPEQPSPVEEVSVKEEEPFDVTQAAKLDDMSRLPLLQRSRRDYKRIYARLFENFRVAMLASERLYQEDLHQRQLLEFLTKRNNRLLSLLDITLEASPALQSSVEQVCYRTHPAPSTATSRGNTVAHSQRNDTSILSDFERVRVEALIRQTPSLEPLLSPLLDFSCTPPILHPAPARPLAELSANDAAYALEEAIPLGLSIADLNEANPTNSIQWMKRNHNEVLQMLSSVGVANNSGGINGTHPVAERASKKPRSERSKPTRRRVRKEPVAVNSGLPLADPLEPVVPVLNGVGKGPGAVSASPSV